MRTALSPSHLGMLWIALALGLLLNLLTAYIFAAEIGKDLFLFGAFPVGALHVSLIKQVLFLVLNAVVAVTAAVLFLQGRRFVPAVVGLLAVLNVAVMLSPAVGTLR